MTYTRDAHVKQGNGYYVNERNRILLTNLCPNLEPFLLTSGNRNTVKNIPKINLTHTIVQKLHEDKQNGLNKEYIHLLFLDFGCSVLWYL
jgi:hypothetical protein